MSQSGALRWVMMVFLLGFFVSDGSADIVRLSSGKALRGEVERAGGQVNVRMGDGISLTFSADDVASIIDEKKNFLWRVESDTAAVYLFGTVHIGKRSFYPLDPVIERAFERSSVLALEIHLKEISPMYLYQMQMEAGTYHDGQTLKDNVSPQTYEKLKARLQKLDLPIKDFERFKPWMMAEVLQGVGVQDSGYSRYYGVESYLVRKAEEQGDKQIVSLETVWQQVSFMDEVQQPELFLEAVLDAQNTMDTFMEETLAVWKEGDVVTAERLFVTDVMQDAYIKSFQEKLLFERNRNMAEKIREFLAGEGEYFVAVGAAHMVGEEGLVEILRRDGYRVRQL